MYKDYFAEIVQDVKTTNLIKYSIDLIPNAYLVKEKLPRYFTKKRDFANTIFLAMENTGIIV